MGRVVLSPTALEKLRSFGDPVLEGFKQARPSLQTLVEDGGLLPASIKLDIEKLAVAQRLFGDYTTEISGALLLAALPQSYATEYGAAVLGARGELENNLTRRIGLTANFLFDVMKKGTAADQSSMWDPTKWNGSAPVDHLPWARCVRLRGFHQMVRDKLNVDRESNPRIKELLGTHNQKPLNQEDLLGMLLTFSFAVFEVLELFGITWTADEQEAYLHLWDVVGGYLAIGSDSVTTKLMEACRDVRLSGWYGLRPPTIEQSRALLEQIRARQWLDPKPEANIEELSWSALRSGRVLARALLDELENGMPQLLKPLPIAVIRALNRDIVCRRLNLGGNGVLLQSLSLLPKREVKVARFTSVRSPNKIAGRVLRALANDVTTRASVYLVELDMNTFPGAADWPSTS